MKPLRLKIEGIKSFARPAEIDFTRLAQGKVFGVFGNTGAGKSTVIDSILYALYGETGDGVKVDEFVNERMERASVAFAFTAEDEHGVVQEYEVTRSISFNRQKLQQSNYTPTSKAELYVIENGVRHPEASGPRDVNAACERIVGLALDDFKNCVVLKQGQYAKFVRARAGDRKKTVVKLFGLEQYGEKLWERAKTRREAVKKTLGERNAALETYGGIDEAQVKGKLDLLNAKLAEEQAAKSSFDALNARLAEAEQNARAYEDYLKSTERLTAAQKRLAAAEDAAHTAVAQEQERVPVLRERNGQIEQERLTLARTIAELEQKLGLEQELAAEQRAYDGDKAAYEAADEACRRAKEQKQTLEEQAQQIKDKRTRGAEWFGERGVELPDDDGAVVATIASRVSELRSAVKEYRQLVDEQGKTGKQIDSLTEQYNEAVRAAQEAKAAREQAVAAEKAAQAELDEARVQNAVHELAARLHEGDACPICGHTVTAVRVCEQTGSAIEALSKAVKACEQEREKAQAHESKCGSFVATVAASLESEKTKHADLVQKLERLATDEKGEERLLQFETMQDRFAELFRQAQQTQDGLAQADKTVAAQEQILVAKREAMAKTAERIAFLKAQLVTQNGESIASLLDGARRKDATLSEERKQNDAHLSSLAAQAAQAASERNAAQEAFDREKTDNDACTVRAFDRAAYDALREECAQAGIAYQTLHDEATALRGDYDRAASDLAKAGELVREIAKLTHELNVCEQMVRLVQTNGFASWIAEGYIRDFTERASQKLVSFTGGEMGLCYDEENGFLIRNNFNGGECRKINTVSGGETFLVSLSVAIAVAQCLGERVGAKRIDFMFIDEGFGTLSQDKIESVLDAINTLARQDLVVGFISHVAEMRSQMPCKLIVERDPNEGSTSRLEGC